MVTRAMHTTRSRMHTQRRRNDPHWRTKAHDANRDTELHVNPSPQMLPHVFGFDRVGAALLRPPAGFLNLA